MSKIEKLESRIAYQNKWMTLREDSILRNGVQRGVFGVVEKPDFVVIVAVENGYIHLVNQYRYPLGANFWELPQGSWEENAEADPAEIAAGELKEETGIEAGSMRHIAHQLLAPGFCTQGYHIFLAEQLTFGEAEPDAEEHDIVSARFSLAEFEDMIHSEIIKDSTTIAAYLLVKSKGLV